MKELEFMNNTQLEALATILKNSAAQYTLLHDKTTLTSAADGAKEYGVSLSEVTPTLIIKADNEYYAAIICGNTRISFGKVKQVLNVQNTSLADPETVFKITGARVGHISLINPQLKTIVDRHVLNNRESYGGCGVPKTTLKINTKDLIRITQAQVLDFADVR